MIYNHFAMRLRGKSAWALRARYGVLEPFVVGAVNNPKPVPKVQTADVSGSNGVVDATIGTFFEAKTVTVVLSGEAEFQSMRDVESAFAPYQGRVVEWTFDDVLDMHWYQYGRLTAEFDYYKNRITLTFINVPPYRFGAVKTLTAITRTNYEKHNNADAWIFDTAAYGTPPYSSDAVGNFAYSFNSYGKECIRKKGVGAAVGAKMLFGIFTLIGGDVWFEDASGNKSKTFATTCPTTISGSTSELRMHFTCDGSYYEWQTVNGERKYLPTVRCTYVLSNYVPIDSDGKIYNTDYANVVTQELSSNVSVRPRIASSAGIVIVDGVAASVSQHNQPVEVNGIIMPSDRADTSGAKVDSVFVWVPADSADVTGASFFLEYDETEVF